MGDVVKMYEGKTVKLNVLERTVLLGLLPKEGTFQNLKSLRILREELSFNDEENKKLQFRVKDQMLTWNNTALKSKETGQYVNAPTDVLQKMMLTEPEKYDAEQSCPEKEIAVTGNLEEIIVKALTKLDKDEKITEEHYSLYEKFME